MSKHVWSLMRAGYWGELLKILSTNEDSECRWKGWVIAVSCESTFSDSHVTVRLGLVGAWNRKPPWKRLTVGNIPWLGLGSRRHQLIQIEYDYEMTADDKIVECLERKRVTITFDHSFSGKIYERPALLCQPVVEWWSNSFFGSLSFFWNTLWFCR